MRTGDAFGQALWDHLQGRDGTHVVEREDGRVEAMGCGWAFSGFKDWPPHVRRALRLVSGRVLDVGCGAGRHALYLQERGHAVVGIDVSQLALKVARKRGVLDARRLQVTRVSRRLGIFDSIIMMGNNFGLMGGERRARWLLKFSFRAVTSPGARIIAELVDPYETHDPEHLAYHRLNRARGRMSGQLKLRIRYRSLATEWFDYLFVSRKELARLVKGTGWRVERCIGDGPQFVAVIQRAL